MTDTAHNKAIVKHERHPDLPPPPSEVGIYGWLYHNLFSTWYNILLTILGGLISVWAIWTVLDYVVFGAVWSGDGREACQTESGALIHACWVFVGARYSQFLYGFYPEAERWRVDFSFLFLILVFVPLFLREEWVKRGVGLAVAAGATLLSLVAYGVGPAVVIALMMFAPYGLVYSKLGALLPRSDENAITRYAMWALAVAMVAMISKWVFGLFVPNNWLIWFMVVPACIVSVAMAFVAYRDLEGQPLHFGESAIVSFMIRIEVIAAVGVASYYLASFVVGETETKSIGWMAAFLAFGLIVLNKATVRAWITFLLIFIYPFIAYFLWVGDGFGLEYVETAKWGGLFLTLVVAGTGIAASLPIGILLALGRRSDMPVVRLASIIFIELWRGVPLITVLFMSSVMLPLFLPEGVNFDKLLRALIGVALFSAAYMAEVVRGGLQAIPKGQYEAAEAMGLGYWQMMRLIVLPQALKLVIPGIVNTFIGLFKDTTLVLVIGLFDLLGIVQAATTDPQWLGMAVEGYVFTAFVFWIFCFGMSRYSMHIERKLHTGHAR